MNCLNKKAAFVALILFLTLMVLGCNNDNYSSEPSGKINIVTTIFPPADFAKNVGGELVEVNMLLKPGAESHTFEPTPQDIKMIQNCDLFIYVGGESDEWIDGILESIDNSHLHTLKMIETVNALSEEHVEGMEEEHESHEDEGEAELDEHVWTSVRNAMIITEAIRDELIIIDQNHENEFRQNAEAYIGKLASLDEAFRETVKNSKRQEIIVADRFPFRYMAHEYGLSYYAAFPGCSADSEPSAKTLSFLIKKVQEDEIPVVFHIEFSNEKVADSVVEVVNAKKSLLHSCHNLSKEELSRGEDYISIMSQNLENLKEALN